MFGKRSNGNKSGTGETFFGAKKGKIAKEMSRKICIVPPKQDKAASGSLLGYCYSVRAGMSAASETGTLL